MEILVACALGVVGVCSYVTLRDIITDLQREGRLGGLAPVRVRRNDSQSRLYRGDRYRD